MLIDMYGNFWYNIGEEAHIVITCLEIETKDFFYVTTKFRKSSLYQYLIEMESTC